MAFSRLKVGAAKPAAAAPAAVPAPEPEVVKAAEPEPVVKIVEVVDLKKYDAKIVPERALGAVNPQHVLQVFNDDAAAVDVTKALMAVTEGGEGVGLIFPILQLSGGNAGGAFAPIKAVPQEIADQMPQGKKPIEAVFMGYRTELAAWPVGYLDRGEDTGKPVWSVAGPCHDPDLARLIRGACSNYQFTKGPNKASWDHDKSGIGHIRPLFQILAYLPSVNDVIVIQTPSHYVSWQQTMENLKKHVDPKTGNLNQFPCVLRAVSEAKIINGNNVTQHTIDFAAALNAAGQEWWKKYATWRTAAKADAEVVAKVNDWLNGLDKPATDEIRAVLRKAESFRA